MGRLIVLMETELENNHKNSPKPACKIRKTVYSMSSYREREFQPQPQGDLKMPNANYKTFTVRDLVDIVNADKKHFPNGLDTPIATGDFEGNYHHILHEVFHGDKVGKNPAILLCYEMHESDGNR